MLNIMKIIKMRKEAKIIKAIEMAKATEMAKFVGMTRELAIITKKEYRHLDRIGVNVKVEGRIEEYDGDKVCVIIIR